MTDTNTLTQRMVRDVPIGATISGWGQVVTNSYSPRGGGRCIVTFDDGTIHKFRAVERVQCDTSSMDDSHV